jgi:hypothetical protein
MEEILKKIGERRPEVIENKDIEDKEKTAVYHTSRKRQLILVRC